MNTVVIGSQTTLGNLAGFVCFYLIRLKDLQNMALPNVDGVITSEIILKPETSVFRIICKQDSIDYKVTSKLTESGTNYAHQITATVIREIEDAVIRFFELNREEHWIALVRDSNKLTYVVGNKRYPLMLTDMEAVHGKKTTPAPERNLSFAALMQRDKFRYEPPSLLLDWLGEPIESSESELIENGQ